MNPPIELVTQPDITVRIEFGKELHTNPSILRWKDRWVMLLRDKMGPSELLVATLDDNLSVVDKKHFPTSPFKDRYKWGAEDPRIFYMNERLLYTYHGTNDHSIRTIIGEVDQDTLQPKGEPYEIVYAPGPEKNWTFFSFRGMPFAINTFAPKHKIVNITGFDENLYGQQDEQHAVPVYARVYSVTDSPAFQWPHGEARGGSPAIRVGEYFYTVFQSHVVHNSMPRYYCAAFAKFSARPPFDVVAVTGPVLIPDEFRDWGFSVVFPAGLQLHNGQTVFSCWIL